LINVSILKFVVALIAQAVEDVIENLKANNAKG
jgi:hypothetical protein